MPVDKETLFNSLQFLFLCMDKGNVSVTPLSHFDCSAGAACNDLYLYAGLLLKQRQNVAEQTRILRARCGCTDDLCLQLKRLQRIKKQRTTPATKYVLHSCS